MTNPIPHPTFRVVAPAHDELSRIGLSHVTGCAYQQLVLNSAMFRPERGADLRSLTQMRVVYELSGPQFAALADELSSFFRRQLL